MVIGRIVAVVAKGEATVAVLRSLLFVVGKDIPLRAILAHVGICHPAAGRESAFHETLCEGHCLELSEDDVVELCLSDTGRCLRDDSIEVLLHLFRRFTVGGVAKILRRGEHLQLVVGIRLVGEVFYHVVDKRTIHDTTIDTYL